jgi:hypothetical protein
VAPPRILRCNTGGQLQAYLRDVTRAGRNFTPTNSIHTRTLAGRAVDVVSGNDLYKQNGSCRRVQVTEFGTDFPLWGLEVTQGSGQGAWVCPTIGAWSYNGSQAVLMVIKLNAEGIGGTFIGPLKGPNRNNPHSGAGSTFGTDRGWTLSSNGGGRYGFAFYGDENLPANEQDDRVFRPNVDMDIGSPSYVGRGYVVMLVGYDPNYGGAGVAAGYQWVDDDTQRPVEYFDAGMGVGNAGDVSCPDGRMAYGAVMYGSNATASDSWFTFISGVLARCDYFTGAAADSIHAHKTTIVETIQAQLDRAAA